MKENVKSDIAIIKRIIYYNHVKFILVRQFYLKLDYPSCGLPH